MGTLLWLSSSGTPLWLARCAGGQEGPVTLPRSVYCRSHERLPASGKLCSDARAL